MDYWTNADGHLTAASLTVVETHLVLTLDDDDDSVTITLKDKDGFVDISIRANEVEDLSNVLADFLAALDTKAGRS